jgi:hypothetical protein
VHKNVQITLENVSESFYLKIEWKSQTLYIYINDSLMYNISRKM